MSEIEISIESGDKCEACGQSKPMGSMPAEQTKDQMIAELKSLLSENTQNGQAERQVKIDEIIKKINEYGQEED